MGQSGFPGFLVLALIVGFIGYGYFLRRVPDNFPVIGVGVAALVPFISWSPLRTWLVQADTVFLMPREGEMTPYMRRSFRNSFVPGLLLAWFVLAVYLPLYNKGDGQTEWLLLAVVLAVLAGFNRCGAWRERQLVWPAARLGCCLLRWSFTALSIAALLEYPLWKAVVFMLLLGAVYTVALRFPQRHRFPWERLIAEEARTRRGYYRFFSAFIDVPVMTSRVVKRSYLFWLTARIPLRKTNTFIYLYTVSLVRTELGGILMRLTAFGMLAAFLAGEADLLSGWGAVAVAFFFTVIIGTQLGSLSRVHTHSVWRHVYPLPDSRHAGSVIAVVRAAHTVSALLVWLPAAVTLCLGGAYIAAGTLLALNLWYTLQLRPGRMKRTLAKDLED
jgi:ABC-2 type transport system permease protein